MTVIGPIGIAAGSTFGGKMSEVVGGIRRLIITANLVAIAANLLKLYMTLPTMLIGRFIFGFTTGLMNFSLNKAINDTVPASHAQNYGLAVNAGICLGLFTAGLCSLVVPIEDPLDSSSLIALKQDENWRIVYSVPILIELLGLFLVSRFDEFSLSSLVQNEANQENFEKAKTLI